MGPDSFLVVARLAEHLGFAVTSDQQARLELFWSWLRNEAVAAGGIGPGELDRLWDRHIADSLTFLPALDGAGSCLDVGSGAGLPGIPLAIMSSSTAFALLDRSGRRCDLMRRAVAVLGLSSCEVLQGDVADFEGPVDAIVSRAAIPPDAMMIHVKRLLEPGGTAILGLSRSERPAKLPVDVEGLAFSVLSIPSEILDSGASLLRIEPT